MLPVCIAGVVVCDSILYFIGRQWGTKLLQWHWVQKNACSLPRKKGRKSRKTFTNMALPSSWERAFYRGIRTPVFIMAGVMRLPFRRFLLADGIYAIPGVNLLFWLAYWFTDQFQKAVEKVEGKVEGNRPIVVVSVVLAAISGVLAYQYLFKRKVTTGDPKDLPVIGKQVATLTHQLHAGSLKREEEALSSPAGDSDPAPPADKTPAPRLSKPKKVDDSRLFFGDRLQQGTFSGHIHQPGFDVFLKIGQFLAGEFGKRRLRIARAVRQ